MPIAQTLSDNLEKVRELERLRIEATRANNVRTLAPLLDESLIYINSVGAIYDKQSYLDAIRTKGLTYDKDFDVRETENRVVDGLIILAGIMLGHARLDGEQQVFHLRYLAAWREFASEWKLVAWASSSIVNKPA